MDCLALLASCIEEEGSAIAPALADPVERRQLERLQQIGALVPARARAIICPNCEAHSVRMIAAGSALCVGCGQVALTAQDLQRLAPDGDWLRRRIAQALGLPAAPAWPLVSEQVWRLGDLGRAGARRRILYGERLASLKTRHALHAVWPSLAGEGRVILLTTTAPDHVFLPGLPVSVVPFASAFQIRGTGLVAAGPVWEGMLDEALQRGDDGRRGPFAQDFRAVLLLGETDPVALTPTQSALLRVLWELAGERIDRQALLRRAKVDLDKPVQAFQRQKYPHAHRAYRALVRSNRQGQYWWAEVRGGCPE